MAGRTAQLSNPHCVSKASDGNTKTTSVPTKYAIATPTSIRLIAQTLPQIPTVTGQVQATVSIVYHLEDHACSVRYVTGCNFFIEKYKLCGNGVCLVEGWDF